MKTQGDKNKARKQPTLRVPKLKEGEGIANLLPEEEQFIQDEIKERVARGWSQEKVAEVAGVDRSTIQHGEHRRRGFSLRVAVLISKAFGKKVEFVPAKLACRLPTMHLLGGGALETLPG